MKKVLAILLALMLLLTAGLLAGCKKGDEPADDSTAAPTDAAAVDPPTDSTAQPTQEDLTVPPTQEDTTKLPTEPKPPLNDEANILSTYDAADEAHLCAFLEHFLWYYRCYNPTEDSQELTYDYASDDAFEIAFDAMISAPFYPLMECMEIKCGYDWSAHYSKFKWNSEQKLPADPRAAFSYDGEVYEYSKYEAEFFDELMAGVFNVQPDHDFEYIDKTLDEPRLYCYYDGGDYYVRYFEGGDGAGPKVRVSDFTALADGKYTVQVDFDEFVGDEKMNDLATLQATVALKEIRGERIWSLYEIHEVK